MSDEHDQPERTTAERAAERLRRKYSIDKMRNGIVAIIPEHAVTYDDEPDGFVAVPIMVMVPGGCSSNPPAAMVTQHELRYLASRDASREWRGK